MNLYNSTKIDLEELLFEKTKGVIFRSKIRWLEEGERCTKYFLSLEKARSSAKNCHTILQENGVLIEKPEQVLEAQRLFYQELYTSDPSVKFTMVNNTNIFLGNDDREKLNAHLSINELHAATMSLKRNRTPGPDGIPVEFYQKFWPQLKEVLYESYLESFQKQKMNSSAMEGVLNLIPKKDKDTRVLKNLRPITLLNVDYKIIEKLVATRIRSVMDKLINEDQTGFMSNRRISVNIRRVIDIMNFARKENKPIIIYNLDFLKAFDRVEIPSMLDSLHFFRYPEFILKWVTTLYQDFTVKVQNNGNFSSPIQVSRSVHQGGCASAFLFNLLAETLAIHLRNKMSSIAIEIAGHKHVLGQYADDTSAFSYFSQDAVNTIFGELKYFQTQTGLSINYDKTTIYRVGSLQDSNATLYTLKPVAWTNEGINVLGIDIKYENIVESNFEAVVNKCQSIINSWKSRRISMLGKVAVLNSLVGSLFVHKMLVLPNLTSQMVKQMDKMFTEFLWNNSRPKIPLQQLQKQSTCGGINLVNLALKQCALKCSWTKILHENESYAALAFSLFAPILKEDIFRCNFAKEDIKFICSTDTPQFWKDVMAAWASFNYSERKKCSEQLIWWNSQIRINNAPCCYPDVYLRGLKYIHQLYRNGILMSIREAHQQFGLDFLRFHSLISAIPPSLRRECQAAGQEEPKLKTEYDSIILSTHIPKVVYAKLQDDGIVNRSICDKWSAEMQKDISESDIVDMCKKIYSITNIPRLRSFQYRFVHRAIVLNSHLFRWNMRESNACSVCGEEKETLLHLFFTCEKIKALWEDVSIFTEQFTGYTFELTLDNIMWCNSDNKLINSIILTVKQHIYSQRCLSLDVNSFKAIECIKRLRNSEKYIAQKHDKLSVHNKKWNC